ncbi:MAG: hypothetical protein Kow0098_19660 [Ignavibacteriaceae bacterium]
MLLKRNKIIFIAFAAAFFIGCSKEKPRSDYIARVNETYLTENDLYRMADSSLVTSAEYRTEIINNWIEKELLFQVAEDEGITTDENFKFIIDNSEKELAAAFLKKKIFEQTEISFSEDDLLQFYSDNKNEFLLPYTAVLLNRIDFSNENKIIQFRNNALESDWNKALNVFSGDKELIKVCSHEFYYLHEIHPASLLRIVKELYPQEISIVLKTDSDHFVVVQLLDKYSAGTIAPFSAVKPRVENLFQTVKKTDIWNEYIQELRSDNRIEIKAR